MVGSTRLNGGMADSKGTDFYSGAIPHLYGPWKNGHAKHRAITWLALITQVSSRVRIR
ncbi:MAG: hypothetical protein RBT11_00730 [Desulfobacterales bacterium]|jgi:hypothetical protein|nr:hypothetical protein [Desulfobacterales bacterium]